jgi:hypothetical protein
MPDRASVTCPRSFRGLLPTAPVLTLEQFREQIAGASILGVQKWARLKIAELRAPIHRASHHVVGLYISLESVHWQGQKGRIVVLFATKSDVLVIPLKTIHDPRIVVVVIRLVEIGCDANLMKVRNAHRAFCLLFSFGETGNKRAAREAMITITASISTSVNPLPWFIVSAFGPGRRQLWDSRFSSKSRPWKP